MYICESINEKKEKEETKEMILELIKILGKNKLKQLLIKVILVKKNIIEKA